jgi:hypothetical protein
MLSLYKTSAVLFCSLITACIPEKPATFSSPPSEAVPVTGAWARADVFNPDVQEAARFAVQAFSVQNKARVMYKEVTQASQQVVAGLNFELQLLVTLDGVHRNVLVKVWRQLDGSYRLLSWVWQN